MSNDLKEFDHFFGESKLSTKERNRLDDKTFGIPDERKYPLNDKSHVIQAARMFNKADEKDKPELAKRILKKAKEFNIDTSRWKLINEYYKESFVQEGLFSKKEHTPIQPSEKYQEFVDAYNNPIFKSIISNFKNQISQDVKKYFDTSFPVDKREDWMSDEDFDGTVCRFMDKSNVDNFEITNNQYETIGYGFATVRNPDDWLTICITDGKVYYCDIMEESVVSNSFNEFLESFGNVFDEYLNQIDSVVKESFVQESNDMNVEILDDHTQLIPADKSDIDNMIEWEMDSVKDSYPTKEIPESEYDNVYKFIKQDAIDSIWKTRIIIYDGKKIGMLTAYQVTDNGYDDWYIGEIYLLEEYRGKGIGSLVMKHEISQHEKLLLNVYKNNESAIKFYKGLGFKVIQDSDDRYIMRLINKSFVQEGAWQDIRNGVNPKSNKLWFHISFDNKLDEKVLTPKVPDWIKGMKKSKKELEQMMKENNRFENITDPRICFSPSIEGCLNAIINVNHHKNLIHKQINVYVPERPISEYKHKTNKEIIRDKDVFDATTTGECWILEPMKVKFYGTIVIDKISDNGKSYNISGKKGSHDTKDKIGRLTYKWHWLIHPSIRKQHERFSDKDTKEIVDKMMKILKPFKYGIPIDGKIINVESSYYDKHYKLLSPEEFEKFQGGICWDYVEWMEDYLKKNQIDCKKYYLYNETKDINTHTFITIELSNGDILYPEASFKTIFGVKRFKSLYDLMNYLSPMIFKINDNDKKYESINWYLWEYSGHPKYGSNPKQCMKYYSKGEPIMESTVKNKKKIVKESYVMNNTERCERYQGIDFNMFDDEPDIVHKSTRTISDFLSTFMEDGEEPVETSEVEEETVEVEEEPQQQFGSDTSDVQNEYDQRDVVTLNDLIAAESQALSEYLDAAKNTRTQLLSRLYSDIGNEERFHLEQLMYAKSTITGEKYVPRDPDVKKEYEELLSTGMDEETAMTTAVDKYGIGMANKQPVEQELEMEELDAVEQDLDMMESFMNVWDTQYSIMYEQMTMKHINVTLMKSYMEFFNTMSDNSEYIFEAVTDANVAAKQLSRNPVKMIWQAFKTVYKFIISIVKKFKTFFDRIRISAKDKREFISRHGIGALFGEGPSLYFWSDKTGKFDEQAPAQYIFLMNSIIEKVIEAATINGIQKPHQTLPPAQQIPFGTMNDGVKKLRGALLTKTKVIVTNDNTEYLEDAFFGVDTRGGNQINSTVKDSKNTNMSSNIYNKLLLILEDLEISAKSADAVLETLNAMPGMQNTLYQNNQSKWNESVNAMKEVVRSFNIFTKAVTNDVNQCVKLNNGLLELMQNYDASRKDLKLPSKDAADAVNKYKEERSKRLHPTDEKGNPISTVTVGTGTSAK